MIIVGRSRRRCVRARASQRTREAAALRARARFQPRWLIKRQGGDATTATNCDG